MFCKRVWQKKNVFFAYYSLGVGTYMLNHSSCFVSTDLIKINIESWIGELEICKTAYCALTYFYLIIQMNGKCLRN